MIRTLLLLTLIAGASSLGACSDDDSSGSGVADAGGDASTGGGATDTGVADTGTSADTASQTDTPPEDTGALADTALPMDTSQGDDTSPPMDSGAPPMDTTPDEDSGNDGPCSFSTLGPADRDRVVLVGQSFSSEIGESETEVRSLTLTSDGTLMDNGIRVDIGVPPHRLEMTPSGEVALALSDEGVLVSLQLKDASDVVVVDAVELPSADYGDLILADGGTRAIVVGTNSAATGGISTVRVACDGTLTRDEDAFYPIRLAQSLALVPGTNRALLLGGQAMFEPIVDDDVRLLEWTGSGWVEVAAFDIFADSVNTDRIAFSEATNTLLIANASLFSEEGAQLSALRLEGDTLTEITRLSGLNDPYEAAFSPDGQTGLVSLFQPGRVVAFAERDGGFVEVDGVSGVGLAAQMAFVRRGSLTGTVLLTSTDPSGGSKVHRLQVSSESTLTDLGETPLGERSEDIPDGITVTP